MQNTPSQVTSSEPSRWMLIRQAIVFQLKLGLDALRDILMSPISIVLVVTDILMANNQQNSYFVQLMKLGKKSDHWINLFGVDSPQNSPDLSHHSESNEKMETTDKTDTSEKNVDFWFTKIEDVIKEQQVDGKLTQSGKDKLQQYFGKMGQP